LFKCPHCDTWLKANKLKTHIANDHKVNIKKIIKSQFYKNIKPAENLDGSKGWISLGIVANLGLIQVLTRVKMNN
jgi:hypothetical protein